MRAGSCDSGARRVGAARTRGATMDCFGLDRPDGLGGRRVLGLADGHALVLMTRNSRKTSSSLKLSGTLHAYRIDLSHAVSPGSYTAHEANRRRAGSAGSQTAPNEPTNAEDHSRSTTKYRSDEAK